MPTFNSNSNGTKNNPTNNASKAGMPSNLPKSATVSSRPASKAGMPSNLPKTAPAAAKPAKKPLDEIVKEVIDGAWGTGADRKAKLEAAGYDYNMVQRAVNRVEGASVAELTAVVDQVIRGEFGNGADRKAKLEAAGFDYDKVQAAVNAKLAGKPIAPAGNLDDIAKAVIRGEYGNGADRKAKLEAAGYDYNAVQARVNELLK